MLLVNQLNGFGVGGDSGKSVTFQTSTFDNVDRTTYTFTSQAIGTAAADRYVIVGVGGGNMPATISSLTVGGNAATQIVTQTDGVGVRSALYIVLVTSGTTADIVVTWNTGINRCGIGVWSTTGLTSTTAVDSDNSTASPGSVTIDTVAGGFAVAYSQAHATPNSWTGVTERFDDALEASISSSGGDVTTTGAALAITVTHGAANRVMVAASF